jgi:hypothetical protein
MNTNPRFESWTAQPPSRPAPKVWHRHISEDHEGFEDGEAIAYATRLILGALALLAAISALAWAFAHATTAQNAALSAQTQERAALAAHVAP